MRRSPRFTKGVLAATVAAAVFSPLPAPAYPIDCAILLCLAGGWPPSAPCAAAKAEFMRRITPWPIEPPLQIWRCPMRASLDEPTWEAFRARIYEATVRVSIADPDWVSVMNTGDPSALAVPAGVAEHAALDISDPVFDVVRSIAVYDIRWAQFPNSNDNDPDRCTQISHTRIGSYDDQGAYRWYVLRLEALPAWTPRPPADCERSSARAVAVRWRDALGGGGHEVVRY